MAETHQPGGKANIESHGFAFALGPLFKFVVGKNKDVVTVHTGVITAAKAPALHKLMTLPMKEGESKEATLPDEEALTFLCFVQWTYTRSYELPTSENSKDGKPIDDARTEIPFSTPYHGLAEFSCRWCRATQLTSLAPANFPFCGSSCRINAATKVGLSRHYCAKCTTKLPISTKYTSTMTPLCTQCEELQKQPRSVESKPTLSASKSTFGFEPAASALGIEIPKTEASSSSKSVNEEASPALIEHAKIAVFADKYAAQDLEKLSKAKLQQELAVFSPTKDNITSVTSLIDYVWTETQEPDSDKDVPENSLRGMVLHYMEDNAKELIKFQEFKGLLQEYPDLGFHGWAKLAKRPRRDR